MHLASFTSAILHVGHSFTPAVSLTLTLHVVPTLPAPASPLTFNGPQPLRPPQHWHRSICWILLYESLTPAQPLCVCVCVSVCIQLHLKCVSVWMSLSSECKPEADRFTTGNACPHSVRQHWSAAAADPATCDSEAAGAQTQARPEGRPLPPSHRTPHHATAPPSQQSPPQC